MRSENNKLSIGSEGYQRLRCASMVSVFVRFLVGTPVTDKWDFDTALQIEPVFKPGDRFHEAFYSFTAPCQDRRLRRLDTQPGEKSGLSPTTKATLRCTASAPG